MNIKNRFGFLSMLVLLSLVIYVIYKQLVVKRRRERTRYEGYGHLAGGGNGFQGNENSNIQSDCTEMQNIIYTRIPKTGSSSLTCIIWRFSLLRNLTVVTPRAHTTGVQFYLDSRGFCLPPGGVRFNIMANHVFYNYKYLSRYFPNNTVLISLVREPMAQFISTLNYLYRSEKSLLGKDKVSVYLSNREKYEPPTGMHSYFHNPMASFFGLPKHKFADKSAVKQMIREIDERFLLVLILERFDESIVLLKRQLCWTMKDILYEPKNVNRRKPSTSVTTDNLATHRNWCSADYDIYEHFLAKFESLVEKEGNDFQEEVTVFRSIQKKTAEYCKKVKDGLKDTLKVGASRYSQPFLFDSDDCALRHRGGPKLLKDIRNRMDKIRRCAP